MNDLEDSVLYLNRCIMQISQGTAMAGKIWGNIQYCHRKVLTISIKFFSRMSPEFDTKRFWHFSFCINENRVVAEQSRSLVPCQQLNFFCPS